MKIKNTIRYIGAPLIAVGLTAGVQADSAFEQAMQDGEFSFNTRTYFFQRSFDDPNKDTVKALVSGGIMKFESAPLHGAVFGAAYYGSHSLNLLDRTDDGGSTGLLKSDSSDYSLLGEVYLKYNRDDFQVTYGRQRLSTPLMNGYDIREVPTTFHGITAHYSGLNNTTIEAGKISSASGRNEDTFSDQKGAWGTGGLAYVYVKTQAGPVDVRGQFINALEDDGTLDTLYYVDAKLALANLGNQTYLKGQYGHTTYQSEQINAQDPSDNNKTLIDKGKFSSDDSSTMYGIKVGTTVSIVDLAVLYNVIKDNNYNTINGSPLYSDWQQGYGEREPSSALGVQVIVHPMDDLSIKGGYVKVSEDRDPVNGVDLFTDDYNEANLDIKYALSDAAKLRVRYSLKDQSKQADSRKSITNTVGRVDSDDLRVILQYNF